MDNSSSWGRGVPIPFSELPGHQARIRGTDIHVKKTLRHIKERKLILKTHLKIQERGHRILHLRII